MKTAGLYSFMRELGGPGVVVGLDEVGRGPLAGPLTVAAVVLPDEPQIEGLDDSKKLSWHRREELAARIGQTACAIGLCHIEPARIDADGIGPCLKAAFSGALAQCGAEADAVLVDGNPLHIHPREKNVVKGDGKVACIAAASIYAKVARDALMVELAARYPGYGLDRNKGYGTAEHIEALRELGPSPVHRMSFLGNILSRRE